MIPKTPDFWYQEKPTFKAALLSPLSSLYAVGHKLNQSLNKTRRAPVPVICVGNITAGGSGKTPVALALVDIIRKHNLALSPHFLTRGYGGSETGPTLIDLKKHASPQVGDEPLLLAKSAPTVVSANRYKGAILAAEKNADVIIMDDGLQNPTIMKDLAFVVIDGESGFGNGLRIPAGPLRVSLEEGLSLASAFILIGQDKHDICAKLPAGKPVVTAKIEPAPLPAGAKFVAFAGLGRPQKFKTTLESLGADIVGWHEFSDHYPYTHEDMQALMKEALAHDASLITTEKDHLRIPPLFKDKVKTLPITLHFDDPNEVVALLSKTLK